MKRIWLVLLAGALLTWNAFAQESRPPRERPERSAPPQAEKKGSRTEASANASASTSATAQAGQNSASISSGTTFEAALDKSLDAKKNKEGDKVFAHTTQAVKQDGQVIIPKGSKLIGHVTQAKARAKGESESALGIVFDQAVLRNGQEIPVNLAIQAVASAQAAASSSLSEGDAFGTASGMGSGRASSSGGVLSSAGSTVGGTAGAVTNTAGAVGSTVGGTAGATANTAASATGAAAGSNLAGSLTSSSTGVIGLQGLSLNSELSNATQGSLIVSSTKNVRLDSGTRMLLRVQGQ
ncbi:MAG: hypothetical protein DMG29_15010 [Acidobacteria bacterium]|nr:MAG: hypothetical protein DMG29_15010 [Acidobacteriota bacterium]